MRNFAQFCTICTILKTWKKPMEECFSRFLNYKNGTKSSKAWHPLLWHFKAFKVCLKQSFFCLLSNALPQSWIEIWFHHLQTHKFATSIIKTMGQRVEFVQSYPKKYPGNINRELNLLQTFRDIFVTRILFCGSLL